MKTAVEKTRPAFFRIFDCPVDQIIEPELAVREEMGEEKMVELCQSIDEVGIVTPLRLKDSGPLYEIISGHRRYVAAVRCKLPAVPAYRVAGSAVSFEAQKFHENLGREEMTAAEEAIYFVELQEAFKWDFSTLCLKVCKSEHYVSDRFEVLRGDEAVFMALRKRQINFSVARELNRCKDADHRRLYLDNAINSEAPHRLVAQWVKEYEQRYVPPNGNPVTITAPPPGSEIYGPDFNCVLCGGGLDPWNLVSVRIHRWELEAIRKASREAAEGNKEV